MKTKIIQFTAGKGPAECTWVVAKVVKIFLNEVSQQGLTYEILQKENGIENGTIQSISIQLKGKHLDAFLEDWIGTIQWIGKSTFRKMHKRNNWFIGCNEIAQNTELEIDLNEIQFQAIRSSGPGGQHVNKVSSAVRATHIPSGIYVLASESRSQHQNKKIAIQRLQEKVEQFNKEQLKTSVQNQWENHQNLERGKPIRIFEGSDFKKKKSKKTFKSTRNQLKDDLKKQIE